MLLPKTQSKNQLKKRRLQRVTLQAHQVTQNLQIHSAIALTPEQKHYLTNVLRLELGAEFIALDRQGGWWLSQLAIAADGETIQAKIIDQLENNSELFAHITLGIAMPKGSNIESIIRQTTELGVRQISPLFSDRTVIKSGTDIGTQKRDRWQRIAEEAAELSLRNYVPEINPPQSFKEWLNNSTQLLEQSHKYICVIRADVPHLLNALQSVNLQSINDVEARSQIFMAIGCEGGWTEREEEMAIAAGFIPVSLGDRVLSAVTAPVVALSIVSAFLEAC
ncbi:16S rRNA (uracil(1498)-N(3))-methyltransferase [Pseudanabaena sp. FACHB-1998]|uniref:RsmE family RNA methyltransferase n=1 Tax=Pseudanabaena sp. FACHB-1998 TaxID=2692858 RepID=UPI00168173F3|nr:16S rRNA (uracil(1498)-N(3))-methyltransferase [Pseudanabaena sp. FACHB-1998]MBD2178523.1 16S rRNA (uracil(1498)-N(3))-methyltransferase [Pseudanabaena sp. FACHB-1998]